MRIKKTTIKKLTPILFPMKLSEDHRLLMILGRMEVDQFG